MNRNLMICIYTHKKKTRVTIQNNPVMLSLTVSTDFLQEIMQNVIKPINYLYINWHWLFQKQSVWDSSGSDLFHMQMCHLLISTIFIIHNVTYILSLWLIPHPMPCFCQGKHYWQLSLLKTAKKILLLTQNYQTSLMCPWLPHFSVTQLHC